jgi:hypothetical protein
MRQNHRSFLPLAASHCEVADINFVVPTASDGELGVARDFDDADFRELRD